MKSENLRTELENGIFVLEINRPQKLNALNKMLLDELSVTLREATGNPAVEGIIITGSGTKAFAAGADIGEFRNLNAAQAKEFAASGQENVFNFIENMQKPVVAAINGFALGGGLELALACHVRLASDHARLGLPEVTLGLIPGYGGTQRLAQIAGKGRAMELILSGEFITAEEAWRIGIVNKVTSPEMLLQDAKAMIKRFTKNSPEALASAIRAVNGAFVLSGFGNEIAEFGKCFETENFHEGVSAFLEKRKPDFGRPG